MASISLRIRHVLQKIQSVLAFEPWTIYPAFNTNRGLGRVALIACILGALLGVHVVLLITVVIMKQAYISHSSESAYAYFLDPSRMQLLIQWCAYIICVCVFHLAEFFATAVYNPRVLSSDSLMVNHSHAYTAAAIVSRTRRRYLDLGILY
jgi:hypothetical protein